MDSEYFEPGLYIGPYFRYSVAGVVRGNGRERMGQRGAWVGQQGTCGDSMGQRFLTRKEFLARREHAEQAKRAKLQNAPKVLASAQKDLTDFPFLRHCLDMRASVGFCILFPTLTEIHII